MKFIHTYTERAFPAIIKSGLWRDGDGLKLMHKPGFLPPDDFNTACAHGSSLDLLLSELQCPFYVDRLQGGLGCTRNYPFIRELTYYYKKLLGDGFLGFQMHEWASNFRSDQLRIEELYRDQNVNKNDPSALRDIWDKIRKGTLSLFLEAYSPDEWAELKYSDGLTGFFNDCEKLYALRIAQTDGLLFPADSYYMAPATEIRHGAKLLLPEAGWQIPNLRVQIAYTRGMSAAAGIPWGIYWECWQNTNDAGFTIPYSLREGQDEWLEDLLNKANGHDLPFENREHGGCSLSLMERAWRYAYFCGASLIAEEYGVCNTFRDLSSAELSPYGQTKKDFLRFIENFNAVGKSFRPFAVVLPKDLPMIDIRLSERWFDRPANEGNNLLTKERIKDINDTLNRIFGENGKYGNYGHVLKCGGFPDVFDIIHADTPSVSEYDCLIDLTCDPDFSKRRENCVPVSDIDKLLEKILPVQISGGLHTAYNRTGNGWLLLCMNNDGILHDDFQPDVFLPEATVHTKIQLNRTNLSIFKTGGTGTLHASGNEYAVTLCAGEWLLLAVPDF
ncbi:MAG: hypothetical protein K6G90_09425 [Clostridia bacterium]|nr:hypothetical protein [Clostridia bacterium]